MTGGLTSVDGSQERTLCRKTKRGGRNTIVAGCKSTKTSNFMSNNKYRVIISHAIIINGGQPTTEEQLCRAAKGASKQQSSVIIMRRTLIPGALITHLAKVRKRQSEVRIKMSMTLLLPSVRFLLTSRPPPGQGEDVPCPSSS